MRSCAGEPQGGGQPWRQPAKGPRAALAGAGHTAQLRERGRPLKPSRPGEAPGGPRAASGFISPSVMMVSTTRCSAEWINMLTVSWQYSLKKKRKEEKKKREKERKQTRGCICPRAGVRVHWDSFDYFLLRHSHPETYNCLLLIKKKKRKAFCTYYRARVCENWIVILSVNLFPRAAMHRSYCC